MTHTTPEHARLIADLLAQSPRTYIGAAWAEQLEAATEARDKAVQSAKYTADLCTQALADLKLVTAERDAALRDAKHMAGTVFGLLIFTRQVGDELALAHVVSENLKDFDDSLVLLDEVRRISNAAIAKDKS